MEDNNLSRASRRNKQTKKQPKKKSGSSKLMVVGVSTLSVIAVVLISGLFYFQSHFFITARANDTDISFLSVPAAYQKLTKANQNSEITLKLANGQEQKIALPEHYVFDEAYLKQNLKNRRFTLPENEAFQSEVTELINSLTFENETPSQDARIEKVGEEYQVIPEQVGTTIDRQKLIDQIIKDTASGQSEYVYNVTDYYQQPALKATDKELANRLTALKQKENKKISLVINDQTREISKEELQTFVNADGSIDVAASAAWLDQINEEYGSIFKPVTFTNIHGTTMSYLNNGSYGWWIDVDQTNELLVAALNGDTAEETVTAVLAGDTDQTSVIKNDYVEIDLNDQKMYFYKDGVQVVATDVITGRYHKGTATVPGFHTILYQEQDTTLKGQMLDGSKYSVPVKYWMPLKSYGGTVTGIGIHDADYKAEAFGNKAAYQTDYGSNGCINTPGNAVAQIYAGAYSGMPVIIYGHIYDDAPGEFDKPVDYGTAV